MLTIILDIVILIILILLSSFFSSSETALTTISPHRLRTMVDEQFKNADILEKVLSNKEKMLSVILICNNIVNIFASSFCTIFVQNIIGNWAVSLGTGVLTVLILIFGEIAPKTIATYRAEKLSLSFCRIIYILMIVFTPIASAVNFLASFIIRLSGVNKNEKSESYTENEIRSIVEVSTEEGSIETEEKDIINNVFDFNDTVVREIMVPRINIVSVNIHSSFEEIRELFFNNFYTRLPVYNDENTSFVGMLNLKDFLFFSESDISDFHVESIMREIPYTFEQKHLSELFIEMKKRQINMMAVMDEYGVTVGIVSMEDLLEEIVGDIRDEYDADEEDDVIRTGKNEFEFHGSMSLSDINDRLGIHLESESYDSVGGLIMELLDRLPEEGDSVEIGNIELTVKKIDGTKIESVILNEH